MEDNLFSGFAGISRVFAGILVGILLAKTMFRWLVWYLRIMALAESSDELQPSWRSSRCSAVRKSVPGSNNGDMGVSSSSWGYPKIDGFSYGESIYKWMGTGGTNYFRTPPYLVLGQNSPLRTKNDERSRHSRYNKLRPFATVRYHDVTRGHQHLW